MVIMSTTSEMWSHAGWPQITVPLGFFDPSEPLVSCTLKTRDGDEVPPPVASWNSHPNRSVCLKSITFRTRLIVVLTNRGFGITFAGVAFSEANLIRIAYAFEQATLVRKRGKTYSEATPKTQLKDIISARVRPSPEGKSVTVS